MFLERRVNQGSSGRVYPLPCVERFAEQATDRAYAAVYLENEFLEIMILPELGGRIHAARDRNLTDEDGPYIELMAGFYTDNQPDFSFLQPGETKTWSQFWYPIQGIGPAQKASVEAALSLTARDGRVRIGATTTAPRKGTVRLTRGRRPLLRRTATLGPDRPLIACVKLPARTTLTDLRLALNSAEGAELLAYQPEDPPANEPAPATEPPLPAAVATNEELYLTGLHLTQYRHPTQMPEPYFAEALRRDPGDVRCNNAVGLVHLINGDFARAEQHFRAAIARLTRRNPNPYDGEPYYNLGLTLRYRADAAALRNGPAGELLTEAYAAFYKAIWNQAWQAAGFHALAEIDCRRQQWGTALDHLDRALRVNADNLRARDLRAIVLRRLGRAAEADEQLAATLRLDPLDWWARHLRGEEITCDSKTRLDLAHDAARAGLYAEALALLAPATPEPTAGTGPMLAYTRAWLYQLLGDARAAMVARRSARRATTVSPPGWRMSSSWSTPSRWIRATIERATTSVISSTTANVTVTPWRSGRSRRGSNPVSLPCGATSASGTSTSSKSPRRRGRPTNGPTGSTRRMPGSSLIATCSGNGSARPPSGAWPSSKNTCRRSGGAMISRWSTAICSTRWGATKTRWSI